MKKIFQLQFNKVISTSFFNTNILLNSINKKFCSYENSNNKDNNKIGDERRSKFNDNKRNFSGNNTGYRNRNNDSTEIEFENRKPNSFYDKNPVRSNYQSNNRGSSFFKNSDNITNKYSYKDVPKPMSKWGSRSGRGNTIPFQHWLSGQLLHDKAISSMKNTSDEDKSLIYNDDVLKALKTFYKGKEISNSKKSSAEFTDYDLAPMLVKNLNKLGFIKLAPIQQKVLPLLLDKVDLIGVAQTGSGKTLGFLLPIINDMLQKGPPELDEEGKEMKNDNIHSTTIRRSRIAYPLAIVIAPTRELARQIKDECLKYTHETGIICSVVHGGPNMREQIEEVTSLGSDIIIATPGRLNDMIKNKYISLSKVKTVVLDEADNMLDMGFKPQITEILTSYDLSPKSERQNIMFSATFDNPVVDIAKTFLNDFYFIGNPNEEYCINKDIIQNIIWADGFDDKYNHLSQIINNFRDEKILIFTNTKFSTSQIQKDINDSGISCEALSGDVDQRMRERILANFKSNKTKIIIATNVAARGLDVSDIKVVVNFDTPNEIDSYVHRIGRTGRKGQVGNSYTFVDKNSNAIFIKKLIKILEDLNQEIPSFLYNRFSTSKPGRGGSSYGNRGGNSSGSRGGNSYGNRGENNYEDRRGNGYNNRDENGYNSRGGNSYNNRGGNGNNNRGGKRDFDDLL